MSGLTDVAPVSHESAVPPDTVRESMRRLPRFLDAPLTMLTGKPYAGQPPLVFTATRHLANALSSLVCGVAASAVAVTVGGWWLLVLVPGWAMTLHGARNLRMMVYHQCAHRNMWGKPRADVALGRALGALLVVQNFDNYSTEHVADHHAVHHMTLRDPTVQAFLLSLELRPGMSRKHMWRRVLGKMVSPRFHLEFLVARVRSHVAGATRSRRALLAAIVVAIAAVATMWHAWSIVLVAWVLPLTVFYQISNTLRLCVKHTFPAPGHRVRRGRDYFASLTNAIFLGEATPGPHLSGTARIRAWARWSARMALVHFPARYLVLTGDTVCHDFHHRHPMSKDWASYLFAREHDRTAGSGWPPYEAVWGLVPAIDRVFDSLRVADPSEFDSRRLARINHRALYATFDD